jgi:L-malate glycosyltransferase
MKNFTAAQIARLCFVGSMVGRKMGYITQQGQILSELFERLGYRVTAVSGFLNRYRRLYDIVQTLIRKGRESDILIIEVYGGPSFIVEDIASRLGQYFNHRIIMWLHGGALPDFMARFPNWSRRVLGRANVIVTPSDFLARAVARYGFQPRIIPNVIDLSTYSYRYRREIKPRLFWMRSFQEIWNPGMAIRVLSRLKVHYPDATLVMAGPDKGIEAEVIRLAETLGLGESVRFVGFLDMEGKKREGNGADIFINTNRIDNSPVAVIEACAMGLPVVTTDIGGIPDLLAHEKTALFVPDDDDQAMALAIQNLFNNSDLAGQLSRNGRLLAERFSWEQVRPQWEALFAEIMGYDTLKEPSRFAFEPGVPNSTGQCNTDLSEIY